MSEAENPPSDVDPDLPIDRHDSTETPEAASRRKFREALDRKKFGHRGQAGGAHDPKASGPHTAPAKPQRTFRRKSG